MGLPTLRSASRPLRETESHFQFVEDISDQVSRSRGKSRRRLTQNSFVRANTVAEDAAIESKTETNRPDAGQASRSIVCSGKQAYKRTTRRNGP